MDWSAWSREAVSLMTARSHALLPQGGTYHWDLDAASFVKDGVHLRLVTVGTVAGDSFLWAWANETIPAIAKRGIEEVRQFGIENDLALLSESCAPGGLAQGKECLAIAGRVLDAAGGWIDRTETGFILFLLFAPTRH
jgi:hypothetical protein